MLHKIDAVRVFTRDLQQARRFFEDDLGLVCLQAESGYALFETGPTTLILEVAVPEEGELVGRFTAISFGVADISAAVDALAARGVPIEAPPEVQDWGGILAHIRDPDGNILTLVQKPGSPVSGS